MRRILLITLMLAVPSGLSAAEFSFGVSANNDEGGSFYLSVGDYYHVPEREVFAARDRRIPDDEIPVVFFLARHCRVAPAVIIDSRLGGRSWMDIALRFGCGPEIFYYPVEGIPGPPYGRAYGYYKHRPRKDWKRIRLGDADVVNLVNLRFISEHYHYAPGEVMKFRGHGRNFRAIGHDIEREHGRDRAPHHEQPPQGQGRNDAFGNAFNPQAGHGHGRGKGHGHGN